MGRATYQFLTELTIIVHLLFILFVVFGGFIASGKRWLTIVHLGAVGWGVFAEMAPGVVCPLTAIENHFGYLAGLRTYQEDFVTRYLVPVIYQDGLTPVIQYILVGIVVGINLIAYKVWRRKLT